MMTINSNIVAVRTGTERLTKLYCLAMTNRHRRNERTKLVINALKTKELHLRQKRNQRVKSHQLKLIQHNLVLSRPTEKQKSHKLHQRKDHGNRMLKPLQSVLKVLRDRQDLQEICIETLKTKLMNEVSSWWGAIHIAGPSEEKLRDRCQGHFLNLPRKNETTCNRPCHGFQKKKFTHVEA